MTLDDGDMLGGKKGDAINPVGIIAVVAQLVVLVISFRPGIKALAVYRAEEARLQTAIESTMAHTDQTETSGSTESNEASLRGRVHSINHHPITCKLLHHAATVASVTLSHHHYIIPSP
jgi:cytochrome b